MARLSLMARSKTGGPIDWLVTQFRQHLHMPDPASLYLLMGAVAANFLEGEPVWMMLVGPSSSGKTELINTLLGIEGMFEAASISDISAFLSATPKKDKSDEATGGLLRQIGDHGGVVINDFTSVLSLDKKTMDKVLGVFRECYSGHWTRHVGAEGGRAMHWQGKAAFFGGVTGAIDRHHEISTSLGERWVYYRMPEIDGFERSRRALQSHQRTEMRKVLKDCVAAFFAGEGLGFGHQQKRRALTDAEMVKIIRIGTVAARCRSSVVRDPYTREVVSAKETEVETRIVTVLGQLLVGMEVVGVPESARWKLLGAVALDSMPRLRRLVIDDVRAAKAQGTTIDALTESLGCSRTTTDRTVEDLKIHGILEIQQKSLAGVARVTLSDWMIEEWKKGWGGK